MKEVSTLSNHTYNFVPESRQRLLELRYVILFDDSKYKYLIVHK